MAFTLTPRKKLAAAAGIIVAAGIGFTLAAFTDNGSVETSFASGTLDLRFDDDPDGAPANYLVDFSEGFDRLTPGTTVDRDFDIYNSGSIDALLSMTAPQIVNSAGAPTSALEDEMTITITDKATSAVLYTGELTEAALANVDISSGGSANGKKLNIAVTLDASAPIAVAGQSIDVVFPFAATQS